MNFFPPRDLTNLTLNILTLPLFIKGSVTIERQLCPDTGTKSIGTHFKQWMGCGGSYVLIQVCWTRMSQTEWFCWCQSLSSLTRSSLQLHRADPDGDGPLQAAEGPKAEQWPHLLLSLPDPARPQVHPLGQCVTPRPETVQPANQHHLRPQGLYTHTHTHLGCIIL